MITGKPIAIKNPDSPEGCIVSMELGRFEDEAPEDFEARLESYINGVHQIEIKRLSAGKWRLAIQLEPQWQETDDHVDNVDKQALLQEFKATTAAVHNNKIDYSKG